MDLKLYYCVQILSNPCNRFSLKPEERRLLWSTWLQSTKSLPTFMFFSVPVFFSVLNRSVLGFVKTISNGWWKVWTNQKVFLIASSQQLQKPTEKITKAKLKLPPFNSVDFVLTYRCKPLKYTRPILHQSFVVSPSSVLCHLADKPTNQLRNQQTNNQTHNLLGAGKYTDTTCL